MLLAFSMFSVSYNQFHRLILIVLSKQIFESSFFSLSEYSLTFLPFRFLWLCVSLKFFHRSGSNHHQTISCEICWIEVYRIVFVLQSRSLLFVYVIIFVFRYFFFRANLTHSNKTVKMISALFRHIKINDRGDHSGKKTQYSPLFSQLKSFPGFKSQFCL